MRSWPVIARRARRFAAVAPPAVCCIGILCTQVANSVQAATAAEREQMAAGLQAAMKQVLELPARLEIDASLREALDAMAHEHLERMTPVFRRWVVEVEPPDDMPNAAAVVSRRTAVRFANELALWRLESPGSAYDDAFLQATLRRPALCAERDGRLPLADQARLLQAMPPAARATALAGERELLARWGQLRPALPARPVPSQAEIDAAAVAAIRSGIASVERPLPPVLAAALLKSEPTTLSRHGECALRLWGLQRALDRPGARREDVLVAYRYATLPVASDWLPGPTNAADAPAAALNEYPAFAARYGITGQVTVAFEAGTDRRAVRPAVVERVIRVDGIDGVRPVAFETALDDASLARAAAMSAPPLTGALPYGSQRTYSVPFAWRLQ